MMIIRINDDEAAVVAKGLTAADASPYLSRLIKECSGIDVGTDILTRQWPDGQMMVRKSGGSEVWVMRRDRKIRFTKADRRTIDVPCPPDFRIMCGVSGTKTEYFVTSDM